MCQDSLNNFDELHVKLAKTIVCSFHSAARTEFVRKNYMNGLFVY